VKKDLILGYTRRPLNRCQPLYAWRTCMVSIKILSAEGYAQYDKTWTIFQRNRKLLRDFQEIYKKEIN
jgi:hypothetical protein